MSHTCPDCGMLCYCGGDIDDTQWDEDSPESDACTHYLTAGCSHFEDDGADFSEYDED